MNYNIHSVPNGLRVAPINHTGGNNTMTHVDAGIIEPGLFNNLYNSVIVGGKRKNVTKSRPTRRIKNGKGPKRRNTRRKHYT